MLLNRIQIHGSDGSKRFWCKCYLRAGSDCYRIGPAMNLSTYLEQPDAMSVGELASAIGCASAQIRQWVAAEKSADAGRRPGAAYCSAIQAATDRAVMRWDLRPEDWHRIWPEMVGAQDAPPIPVKAAA